MPGSDTSVFSEPGDFEVALREEGGLGLLITGRGRFRGRLTQVKLHRLRLSVAEEKLSRIAFIAVPADLILVSLPIGKGASVGRDPVRLVPCSRLPQNVPSSLHREPFS